MSEEELSNWRSGGVAIEFAESYALAGHAILVGGGQTTENCPYS